MSETIQEFRCCHEHNDFIEASINVGTEKESIEIGICIHDPGDTAVMLDKKTAKSFIDYLIYLYGTMEG